VRHLHERTCAQRRLASIWVAQNAGIGANLVAGWLNDRPAAGFSQRDYRILMTNY
jgi:hypothetical protein